jgi:hypothetical protein
LSGGGTSVRGAYNVLIEMMVVGHAAVPAAFAPP